MISVRHLAEAGENVVDGESQADTYATHSQASSPRVVTSPQLPSPGACFYDVFINELLKEIPKFDTGDLHPINSHPCRAYHRPSRERAFSDGTFDAREGDGWLSRRPGAAIGSPGLANLTPGYLRSLLRGYSTT